MKNEQYMPTSYFFEQKKWEENFANCETNMPISYADGLVIGSLLRDVDDKCAEAIKASNGVSELEIISYQQFRTINLLLAINDGNFTGDVDSELENIHETSQLCLKVSNIGFSGYKDLNLYNHLHHLASKRLYLTNQWHKIFKSKWSFKNKGFDLVLSPCDSEIDFGEKIAIQRFEDHLIQLSEKAALDGGFVDSKIQLLPSDVFNTNTGLGINYKFPNKESAIYHQSLLNQYPFFYIDYIYTPLKEYKSLNLSDVRYFWIVFFSLSQCIIKTFLNKNTIKLPVSFTKKRLIEIITKCIDLNIYQAEQLIDLHTSTKNNLTDFYLKPIYKIGEDYFISLGVFLGGQFTRVIDEIVKNQLETKDTKKGKFFEKNFKTLISEQISKNKILKNGFCRVLSLGFKQSKGNKNEEIDIVIRIGETYLLIEAKSFIYRIGVTGYHNNLNEMKESNASQKIDFFISEYDRFKENFDKDANFALKKEKVVFCYLTSVPHATGIKINNMPVVDSSILERYFGQGNFELRNRKNESKLFNFYNNFEEAEKNIKRYLDNPPQLTRLKKSFSYVESDHVMKLNGINVYFQEAIFDLNEEVESKIASDLWLLADYWHKLD